MADYFLDRYGEVVKTLDRALSGNLGRNTQLMGWRVLAASYAQLTGSATPSGSGPRRRAYRPFLDAERFAGQFGTQPARDHMLEGLKKAGFR
jgi:hypothetical protein